MKIINQVEELGACFQNASLIMGSGLVYEPNLANAWCLNPFDPETELLQEETAKRIQRVKADADLSFDFLHKPVNCGMLKSPLYALCTTHPYNYYHFLIESLPDFLYLKQNQYIDDDFMIVTGLLHPNFRDALTIAMNGATHTILKLKLMQKIDGELIMASTGAVHGEERINGAPPLFQMKSERLLLLRNLFKEYWAPSGHNRLKIFVSRKSIQRHLENMDDLEELARQAGYQVIQPEHMSFLEQIHVFSRAEKIVGPTGAWLANLAFVPDSAKVNVLYPQTCTINPTLWKSLGLVFGIDVEDHFCPITKFNDYQPIHSDFICPRELAMSLL